MSDKMTCLELHLLRDRMEELLENSRYRLVACCFDFITGNLRVKLTPAVFDASDETLTLLRQLQNMTKPHGLLVNSETVESLIDAPAYAFLPTCYACNRLVDPEVEKYCPDCGAELG